MGSSKGYEPKQSLKLHQHERINRGTGASSGSRRAEQREEGSA